MSILYDRHFNIQTDGMFGVFSKSFYLHVQLKWWVCSKLFPYQSYIPHVTSVREGPAGSIKHHHLTSTHRHPELTCKTKKKNHTHMQCTYTLSVISQYLITNPSASVCSSKSRKMSLSSNTLVGKNFEFRTIFPPANPTQTYVNGQLLPWLLHKHTHARAHTHTHTTQWVAEKEETAAE